MQRVRRSTAVAVLPAPPAGGTAGYFAKPDPQGGVPATVPGFEWYNNVQEELVSLVLAAGLVLADNDPTQLVQAIIKKGLQGSYFNIGIAGGTADAITATYTPAIAALSNGMTLYVRAGAANATTTPTFTPAVGAIAAKTIIKGAGAALAAGDIAGGGHWIELQYDQTLDQWVLLNPATGVSSTAPAQIQSQTYTAFTTAGSSGTFTLTPSPAITAYAAGQRFRVKFHVAGNGADTINVSGKGVKSIKQYDNTGAKVAPVIALNQLADVEFDGVDFVILDPLPASSLPTGAIIYVPAASAPVGFLKANGALISRTAYPALWAYAQASGNIAAGDGAWVAGQFSPGDGSTTFRIPDLRGEFLRGWDDGRGVDASRGLGSAQAAALGNHYHGTVSPTGYGFGYYGSGTITSDAGRDGFADFNDSTPSAKHPETRPRNIAVLACIKY